MNIKLTLRLATETDMPYLKEKMMESFSIAAIERFGEKEDERSPHADELERAYRLGKAHHSTGYKVYCIMKDGAAVGGAVLIINEESQHNKLDLFFIFKEYLNQGLGAAAWEVIEREHPKTVVWELVTPYFEKRNINFYINKCGFHIVKYFNKYHPDPLAPFPSNEEDDDDGYFLFMKEML